MIIILPCCWCPGKYVISDGYIVKGTGLAPLPAHLPGVAGDAVSAGPGAGMLIKILFLLGSSVKPDKNLSLGVSF